MKDRSPQNAFEILIRVIIYLTRPLDFAIFLFVGDAMNNEPKSLQEAIIYFSNPDNCIEYLKARRWPDGVVCPNCGSDSISFNPNRRTWKCSTHHPRREFSVKVGTIFEDSPIPLDKWLTATWMLTNCKNGISSYEIARDVKVTQKSAWFMLHRIRLALQDDFFGSKLGGEVEVDETFIGGKARNMHVSERKRRITGTGTKDKTAVMGILERGGKVRATVVPSRRKSVLQEQVREHVTAGAALYTDALLSYEGLATEYAHQVIDHATQYVDGRVHTNGLENFWSLLKRGIAGTYVSVEPFHLFRYLDEQMFRFNNRKDLDDAGRFNLVVSQIVGKRLTFAQLTGKPN
jgi:transposase-like protein